MSHFNKCSKIKFILRLDVVQVKNISKKAETPCRCSEILLHKPSNLQNTHTYVNNNNPDGQFADSIESSSSLVHTIDVIRNNSLCNLYYATPGKEKPVNQPAPQVPKRNEKPIGNV